MHDARRTASDIGQCPGESRGQAAGTSTCHCDFTRSANKTASTTNVEAGQLEGGSSSIATQPASAEGTKSSREEVAKKRPGEAGKTARQANIKRRARADASAKDVARGLAGISRQTHEPADLDKSVRSMDGQAPASDVDNWQQF
jgi:hypothetical protein